MCEEAGVRKKRNAEETKSRVLESAELMFAEKGFHGTSLESISRASGISSGLILYHFKSKEQLYKEVMEKISSRYAKVLNDLRETRRPPKEMMHEALKAVFHFWKTDRTYNRISLWSHLERREETAAGEARLTAGLAAYLEGLQKNGNLSADVHPMVFLSMIIGPIQFWLRYKDRFAEILHLQETDEALDELFLQQFIPLLTMHLEDSG
jgi:AcrR family transcriptional regulator